MRIGRISLAGLISLLLLGAPATVQASSLVYTNGNNVWLANPDGTGQYQVTLDGTSSNPYSSPSQDNNGNIEAIRGSGSGAQIYRMTQNGTQLNAPFSTAVPGTGPLDAVISPDGSKVSYWGVTGTDPCYPWLCYGTARTYQVSYADHYVDPSTFAPNYSGWSSVGAPEWLSNTREMLFAGSGTMWYYDLGTAEYQQWFQADPTYTTQWYGYNGTCCNVSFEEGAASQDGTRLAIVIANSYVGEYEIALFSAPAGGLATGNPPATPTLSSCVIRPPDGSAGSNGAYPGGALFDSLSWSPDDSSLAYEYNGAIYVAKIASLTDCTQDTFTRVISSGSDPYWGTANVNPPPRPPSGTSPPASTSPPTISGAAQQGRTLSEARGSWTNNPVSYGYQWQRCNSSGSSCSAIPGATGQTYVLSASDVGHTIRVQETASNAGGTGGPATSTPTGVVTSQLAPPPPPPPSAACHVPKLTGDTLAAAKRAIGSTHCKLGKVTRRHVSRRRKRGRVISQSPRAGTSQPEGTKVNLVVGR